MDKANVKKKRSRLDKKVNGEKKEQATEMKKEKLRKGNESMTEKKLRKRWNRE